MGYPVLQPVLQFNQNGLHLWQFQSWFVYGNVGVSHTAPAFNVKPGEMLTSYMQQNTTSPGFTCFSGSLNQSTTSVLTTAPGQTGWTPSYNYAMLVLETISVNTCGMLPGAPNAVIFTDVTVNKAVPAWTSNIAEHDCNQGLAIAGGGATVTMSWTN